MEGGDRSARKVVYEPDARHVQKLIQDLGMEKASGMETPAEARSANRQQGEAKMKPLDLESKQLFRSRVMRAASLSQDDPGIAEAVKGLARCMSSPNEGDLSRSAASGPNGGGLSRLRRSTTGLALRLGKHCAT